MALLNIPVRIALLSFILLFAEVMAIRWIGVEIPVVRVFPNLIVMVILVASSAGLSIANAEQKRPRLWASMSAVAVVGLIGMLSFAVPLHMPSLTMRVDAPITEVLKSIVVLCIVIFGLYVLFRQLGIVLGRALEEMPALEAYSYNLLGSIAGVVAFGFISMLNLAPWVWVAALGLACSFAFRSKLIPILTIALVALSFACTRNSYWSAYSKLDVLPLPPGAQAIAGSNSYMLYSNNHHFHSALNMLDAAGLAKLAATPASDAKILKEYYRWLQIPMKYAPSHTRVLVLGAGSGNDVAFALKAGAEQVHAVEIDPVITSFGYKLHPNKPYTDPRVVVHNEDARTFLRYFPGKFDLIEFAYLDPGATVASASFLRVDNYVYTTEAMKGALNHLTPNGTVSLTFASGANNIITHRLYQAITEASGGIPPIAYVDEGWDSVLFLFGPGAKQLNLPDTMDGLRRYPRAGEQPPTKAATDDWPFLYVIFDPAAMYMYFAILVVAVVLPTLLIATAKGSTISGAEWGNMFFLGQAFMLIETKSITKLSLLFGATWVVSSIVILFILLLAYAATVFVSRTRSLNAHLLYAGLFLALLFEYFVHIPAESTLPPLALSGLASAIATLPILFSSTIFCIFFRRAQHPATYLSANLLGVGVGGLTENLALVTGLQNLSLVAILIYFCSYVCALKTLSSRPGPTATEF